MIFDDLEIIEQLSLEGLRSLWNVDQRWQNKKSRFKAPLMVSAHQLKHLNKMDELECDALMINLEDGVAPEQKERALHNAALFINQLSQTDKKVIVRINPLDETGKAEIALLNEARPDAIRVAKVNTPEDVCLIEALVHESIEIHLSIETAQAWHHLDQLKTSPRVKAFYLGILDLCADLKLPQSIIEIHNPTMHYLLSHFLIRCKVIGVLAVSFVYQEYQNMQAFQSWIELEKLMGFESKGVIAPKQVHAVMQTFSNEAEYEKALYIVKRFEEMQKKGVTGFVDDTYGFIDEPIYKGALVILDTL